MSVIFWQRPVRLILTGRNEDIQIKRRINVKEDFAMPRIEEMFAFISEDQGPEDEGLVGMSLGQWIYPLVGADMARVESLRPHAKKIAQMTGKKIRLIRFTSREDMEEIA